MTTVANRLPREFRPSRVHTGFDVEKVRRDFPILAQRVRGKKLVYLDNAATSQKPQVVIDAISRYYEEGNANIHRGVHYLSEHARNRKGRHMIPFTTGISRWIRSTPASRLESRAGSSTFCGR